MLPSTLFSSPFLFHDPSPPPEPPASNFTKFSSRLPALEEFEENEAPENVNRSPWSISISTYETIRLGAQTYAAVLPAGCSLPSRYTLAGYLEIHFKCVRKFLPFIHVATFEVERLLAMAVLGALYRLEYEKAYELYFMAKAILAEKKRREDLEVASELLTGQNNSVPGNGNELSRIQTLVLMVYFASWGDKRILPDALPMGSQLALLMRENGISEPDEIPEDADWLTWAAVMERRRTLLMAYVQLNLHSIAFNTPPLILNSEVGLYLPGYAEQWKAKNSTQWQQSTHQRERPFRSTLNSFLIGTQIPPNASISSFSNYILIQALIQQIYLTRQTQPSLSPENIQTFETTLRTWQLSWEQPQNQPSTPCHQKVHSDSAPPPSSV